MSAVTEGVFWGHTEALGGGGLQGDLSGTSGGM